MIKYFQSQLAYSGNKTLIIALLAVALISLLSPDMAYAAGLSKVNDFMDNVAGILRGAAIITVTVAIMWAGYKFLFANANAMEVGKIIIAGLLIGGAAEIAGYLIT